jgi:hypothetical protein
MQAETKRLGDLLCEDRVVNKLQVRVALQEQSSRNIRLGSALVQLGYLPEAKLAVYLSRLTHLPCVNPEVVEVPDEVIGLLTAKLATEWNIYPLRVQGDTLHLAVADPLDESARDDLAEAVGLKVVQLVAPELRLRNAIRRRYPVSR